jgi:hypothetical protein
MICLGPGFYLGLFTINADYVKVISGIVFHNYKIEYEKSQLLILARKEY